MTSGDEVPTRDSPSDGGDMTAPDKHPATMEGAPPNTEFVEREQPVVDSVSTRQGVGLPDINPMTLEGPGLAVADAEPRAHVFDDVEADAKEPMVQSATKSIAEDEGATVHDDNGDVQEDDDEDDYVMEDEYDVDDATAAQANGAMPATLPRPADAVHDLQAQKQDVKDTAKAIKAMAKQFRKYTGSDSDDDIAFPTRHVRRSKCCRRHHTGVVMPTVRTTATP